MNRHPLGDLASVFLFVGGCGLIGGGSLLRPPSHETLSHEARPLAPFPPLKSTDDLKRFPDRFEAFLQDRLLGREALLHLHATFKVHILGVSSSPKVILGSDGWLFFDASTDAIQRPNITPHQQAQSWLDSLQRWRDWCQRRQIRYFLVLIPEKQSVYPDKLPPERQPPQPESAAEHFRRLAPSVLGDAFLDLLPPLQQAKTQKRVFFQTDTHWNDDGAWVGYAALADRLGLEAIPTTAMDEVLVPEFIGDLARMLHLPRSPRETIRLWRMRQPRATRRQVEVPLDRRWHSPRTIDPEVWVTGDASRPRGAIFHDSFAERLWRPLLAEHFAEMVFAPAVIPDPQVIERFQPEIVVHQFVERRINYDQPVAPP